MSNPIEIEIDPDKEIQQFNLSKFGKAEFLHTDLCQHCSHRLNAHAVQTRSTTKSGKIISFEIVRLDCAYCRCSIEA